MSIIAFVLVVLIGAMCIAVAAFADSLLVARYKRARLAEIAAFYS